MKYGVYGNLILIYPKPYSIYLRGTISVQGPLARQGGFAFTFQGCKYNMLRDYTARAAELLRDLPSATSCTYLNAAEVRRLLPPNE